MFPPLRHSPSSASTPTSAAANNLYAMWPPLSNSTPGIKTAADFAGVNRYRCDVVPRAGEEGGPARRFSIGHGAPKRIASARNCGRLAGLHEKSASGRKAGTLAVRQRHFVRVPHCVSASAGHAKWSSPGDCTAVFHGAGVLRSAGGQSRKLRVLKTTTRARSLVLAWYLPAVSSKGSVSGHQHSLSSELHISSPRIEGEWGSRRHGVEGVLP